MAREIQIRRGTATQHTEFTGKIGEVTMDTTNKTLRVHDGETPGGFSLARQSALDAADYVVATWHSDDGTQWYRKYKSGWCEQGGISQSQNITLPIEMADTNYTIQLTGFADIGNNNVRVHGWRDVTVTGFITQCNILNSAGNAAADNRSKKYWLVSGFAALSNQ